MCVRVRARVCVLMGQLPEWQMLQNTEVQCGKR